MLAKAVPKTSYALAMDGERFVTGLGGRYRLH
jgi:hypothetical protein